MVLPRVLLLQNYHHENVVRLGRNTNNWNWINQDANIDQHIGNTFPKMEFAVVEAMSSHGGRILKPEVMDGRHTAD